MRPDENADPFEKVCYNNKIKAAATLDGIRRGILALQKAKVKGGQKAP